MRNEQILILTVSIKRLLRRGATKQLINIINKTHMADLSIVFDELSNLNRQKLFQLIKDPEQIGILFSKLDEPIFLEFVIRHVAARFAFIRNAHHSDLLLCKEILHHVIDFCHKISPNEKSKPQRLRLDFTVLA